MKIWLYDDQNDQKEIPKISMSDYAVPYVILFLLRNKLLHIVEFLRKEKEFSYKVTETHQKMSGYFHRVI